jgi:hypothetical protein
VRLNAILRLSADQAGMSDTWLHHEYEALAVRGPLVALDVIGYGSQRPRLSAATIEKHDLA